MISPWNLVRWASNWSAAGSTVKSGLQRVGLAAPHHRASSAAKAYGLKRRKMSPQEAPVMALWYALQPPQKDRHVLFFLKQSFSILLEFDFPFFGAMLYVEQNKYDICRWSTLPGWYCNEWGWVRYYSNLKALRTRVWYAWYSVVRLDDIEAQTKQERVGQKIQKTVEEKTWRWLIMNDEWGGVCIMIN